MTSVDFYFNAADKLQVACRLAGKAMAQRKRLLIYAPQADTAQRIDRLLWTWQATGFVPHCRCDHRLAPLTPVIVDHRGEPLIHDQVLVNLCDDTPPFFSRFQRLAEIVSTEDQDREAARSRFRFYRDRGYEIVTHQLGGTES